MTHGNAMALRTILASMTLLSFAAGTASAGGGCNPFYGCGGFGAFGNAVAGGYNYYEGNIVGTPSLYGYPAFRYDGFRWNNYPAFHANRVAYHGQQPMPFGQTDYYHDYGFHRCQRNCPVHHLDKQPYAPVYYTQPGPAMPVDAAASSADAAKTPSPVK